MKKLLNAFWIDTYLADPMVPVDTLMKFNEEAPALSEKRKASIEYLRSRPQSRYVLDGAEVNWKAPEVLRRAA